MLREVYTKLFTPPAG